MAKKLQFEVTDMNALQAAYPNAVKKVVVVKEDYTELYKIAKAKLVLGEAIAGVRIHKPDGTTVEPLPGTEASLSSAILGEPVNDAA